MVGWVSFQPSAAGSATHNISFAPDGSVVTASKQPSRSGQEVAPQIRAAASSAVNDGRSSHDGAQPSLIRSRYSPLFPQRRSIRRWSQSFLAVYNSPHHASPGYNKQPAGSMAIYPIPYTDF